MKKPENSTRGDYVILTNQLSNEALLEEDKRRETADKLFPEHARLSLGRIIDPKQFIIAGKDPSIDKLKLGDQFLLQQIGQTARIRVKVLKTQKPSPVGKRYVLLETVDGDDIDNLEGLQVDIFDLAGNSVGQIHGGGGSDSGGGRGHSGQASCYGVGLIVRPIGTPDISAEIRYRHQIASYEHDAFLGNATIAVLDTGIWFNNPPGPDTTCSDISWNFVTGTQGSPFPVDDHTGLHGTKICSIIKHTAPDAGILPVKVSNQNGTLTLYDALCGLEFARTHGAKVVNASWSFTANGHNEPTNDYPLLLRAIRDLEESGVIVVAAAGNRSQYDPAANGHIGAGHSPKIYPACYSLIQNNVITVTTVISDTRHSFSVYENYSPAFVDTGALANGGSPAQPGEFLIPGFWDSYDGSSFAVPYVAAKVAQVLSTSTGYMSRRALLHKIRAFHEEPTLADQIRDGGSYVTV